MTTVHATLGSIDGDACLEASITALRRNAHPKEPAARASRRIESEGQSEVVNHNQDTFFTS